MAITETQFGLFKTDEAGDYLILGKEESRGSISFVSICNEHGSISATVDLYTYDGTSSFYIIKNVVIPPGVTLVLNEGLSFDNNTLDLKINQVGAVSMSIIIK